MRCVQTSVLMVPANTTRWSSEPVALSIVLRQLGSQWAFGGTERDSERGLVELEVWGSHASRQDCPRLS